MPGPLQYDGTRSSPLMRQNDSLLYSWGRSSISLGAFKKSRHAQSACLLEAPFGCSCKNKHPGCHTHRRSIFEASQNSAGERIAHKDSHTTWGLAETNILSATRPYPEVGSGDVSPVMSHPDHLLGPIGPRTSIQQRRMMRHLSHVGESIYTNSPFPTFFGYPSLAWPPPNDNRFYIISSSSGGPSHNINAQLAHTIPSRSCRPATR